MSDAKAWLIDLDGTLYRPIPVKVAMAVELAILGWSAVPTVRRFRKIHEELRVLELECTPSPFVEQLHRTSQAMRRDIAEVEAVAFEWMQRRPGKWIRRFRRAPLIAEIQAFRGRGGQTALVSDYPAAQKLRALGIRELFDEVVASGEEGGPLRLKPSPEGYLMAAKRLGVAPASCIVIGDRADADGAAAHAAGMPFRLIR